VASENLELAQRIYAEFERGDWTQTWWTSPEFELVFKDGLSPGVHSGPDAVARAWRDFLSTWEDLGIVAEEYLEVDENRVLVLVHNTGRGKKSGLDIETTSGKTANLLEFRDGELVRMTAYWDRSLAFADLGL
jgi:ketosteroid isomerase-like protein